MALLRRAAFPLCFRRSKVSQVRMPFVPRRRHASALGPSIGHKSSRSVSLKSASRSTASSVSLTIPSHAESKGTSAL